MIHTKPPARGALKQSPRTVALCFALLGACHDRDADPRLPPDAGPDADAGEPHCATVWGYLVAHAVPGASVVPATAVSPTTFHPARDLTRPVDLAVTIDSAEAETRDGRVVECRVVKNYWCADPAGIRSVTLTHGMQSFTREVDDCFEEDPENLVPEELAACVPQATLVIEGRLRGLAPGDASQIKVDLIGATPFLRSVAMDRDWLPTLPCEVTDDRFRCTTLGYRDSSTHWLRLALREVAVFTERFELEVHDCEAPTKRLDVQAGLDAGVAFGALLEATP